MTNSVNITQLIDWLEGRLKEDEEKAVTAAVQASGSHQATIAWLQTFLNLSRSTVLREPPGELLPETKIAFQEFARGKRPAGWLHRLVATLAFDSWQRSSLAGIRRAGLDVVPRQLVYRSDIIDIVLNTRAGARTDVLDLVGQVFPHHATDPVFFTVQLLQEDREVALTYTDALGKFSGTELAAGVYTLIISDDRVEITIADAELSA
ncbi:MAG TPA: hypothetical protein VK900_10670 [Anaerolineales bacterium]|nr:hypothetical protein [Anaerolineales bacterium]